MSPIPLSEILKIIFTPPDRNEKFIPKKIYQSYRVRTTIISTRDAFPSPARKLESKEQQEQCVSDSIGESSSIKTPLDPQKGEVQLNKVINPVDIEGETSSIHGDFSNVDPDADVSGAISDNICPLVEDSAPESLKLDLQSKGDSSPKSPETEYKLPDFCFWELPNPQTSAQTLEPDGFKGASLKPKKSRYFDVEAPVKQKEAIANMATLEPSLTLDTRFPTEKSEEKQTPAQLSKKGIRETDKSSVSPASSRSGYRSSPTTFVPLNQTDTSTVNVGSNNQNMAAKNPKKSNKSKGKQKKKNKLRKQKGKSCSDLLK